MNNDHFLSVSRVDMLLAVIDWISTFLQPLTDSWRETLLHYNILFICNLPCNSYFSR